MIDDRTPAIPYNNPTLWQGRFIGNGTSVPNPVAFTSRKMTLTRSGVGSLSLQLSDPTLGQSGNGLIGVVEANGAWVNTSLIGGANLKDAVITPIAANASAFTITIQFRNGSAVDLTSNDELNVEIWTSRSATP